MIDIGAQGPEADVTPLVRTSFQGAQKKLGETLTGPAL